MQLPDNTPADRNDLCLCLDRAFDINDVPNGINTVPPIDNGIRRRIVFHDAFDGYLDVFLYIPDDILAVALTRGYLHTVGFHHRDGSAVTFIQCQAERETIALFHRVASGFPAQGDAFDRGEGDGVIGNGRRDIRTMQHENNRSELIRIPCRIFHGQDNRVFAGRTFYLEGVFARCAVYSRSALVHVIQFVAIGNNATTGVCQRKGGRQIRNDGRTSLQLRSCFIQLHRNRLHFGGYRFRPSIAKQPVLEIIASLFHNAQALFPIAGCAQPGNNLKLEASRSLQRDVGIGPLRRDIACQFRSLSIISLPERLVENMNGDRVFM